MIQKVLDSIDLTAVTTKLTAWLPNLLFALILAVAFWIGAVVVRKAMAGGLRRAGAPPTVQNLLLRSVRYIIIVVALLTIANQLGINVTSLVAGFGIAGLAVSFAAQDTIANIISGVAIVIDKPFTEGDWISIGDLHASVSQIRLRTTVLSTFDNETVVLPNKMLSNDRIVNYTLSPRIRVRVGVGIAYKEDIDRARAVMLGTLEGDDRIADAPAPVVVVTSLGDSSVNLELRFWTEDSIMKFPLQWEYTEKCKKALDDADIEIPFPHLQMFVERSEGLAMLTAGKGEE